MVIDTYLFVNMPDDSEITRRLPSGWREYLGTERFQPTSFPISISTSLPLQNPLGQTLPAATPATGGFPGSDLGQTLEQHLDSHGIGRALVCHDRCRSVAVLSNSGLSLAVVRASNDWMREVVLAADERLFGTLILPIQSPSESVKEIQRIAADPKWAAVTISANGLGRPLGHPLYHPIYEAAAEAGLPVLIDAAIDTPVEVATGPASWAVTTFTDLYALSSQSPSTHLVSMIGQGVFELWPQLTVFMVGAGVAWITPLLWRFDADYKAFRRDAPALTKLPSEYVAQNVRIGTYPIDRFKEPHKLQDYLRAEPVLEDVLCYASGYPTWDCDSPADVDQLLPAEWRDKIVTTNAAEAFRWPAATSVPAAAG